MKKGSITVFMSIVYLVLVSFCLSLVETYRIQYLYAKQEELSKLAIHNLKSDYLVDILEEYGLLFYSEKEASPEEILDRTFQTGFQNQVQIRFWQDVFVSPTNTNDYPIFEAGDYQYYRHKKRLVWQDFKDCQSEALAFMQDKIPFLMAEPWFEKLKLWEQSQKAEDWIKKKEELLKNFIAADDKAKKLYFYMDGIHILPHSYQVEIIEPGLNHYCLNQKEISLKTEEIRKQKDLPLELQQKLIANLFNVQVLFEQLTDYLVRAMEIVNNYLPYPEDQDIKAKKILDQKLRAELQAHTHSFPWQEMEKFDLKNKYYNAQRLTEEILAVYNENIPKLKDFLQELDKAELSHLLKSNLKREVESVLQNCDVNHRFSRIGNYQYLKEKLENEKDIYFQVADALENYRYRVESLISEYERALRAGQSPEIKIEPEILVEMERSSNYFYFPMSYQGYQEKEVSISAEELTKMAEKSPDEQIEAALEWMEEWEINAFYLPSKEITPDLQSQGQKTITEILDGELLEPLILNQYFFEVFRHFALPAKEEMAISGYDRADHVRKGELEYLLFGDSEYANRKKMVATLFASRLALNIIALCSDPKKMSLVQSMATAIAGWWSLGAGTAILTGVLVTLWASLETGADIFLLFRGQRVPLIKTPNAWYTSISGGLPDLLVEGVDAMAERAENYLNEGLDAFVRESSRAAENLGTDLRYFLENQVMEESRQMKCELDYLKTNIEEILKTGLGNYANGEEKARENCIEALKNLGLPKGAAENLSARAFEKMEKLLKNATEQSLLETVEKVEESLQENQSKIERFLREKQNQMEEAFRRKLEDLASELKAAGKKKIQQQKQYFKQKIQQKLGNAPSESTKSGKEKDIRDYLALNYQDYLRIYLLSGLVSEDLIWLRAMDLIQQNRQKWQQDFYLLDCERRFEVECQALYKPLFFKLKAAALENQNSAGYYQIRTVFKGGFE